MHWNCPVVWFLCAHKNSKVDSCSVIKEESTEPQMCGCLILVAVHFTFRRGEKVLSQFCLETWFNPVVDIWYSKGIFIWNTLSFAFTGEFRSYYCIPITGRGQGFPHTGVVVNLKKPQRGEYISRIIRKSILTGVIILNSPAYLSFWTPCYSHSQSERRRFIYFGYSEEVEISAVFSER